MKALIGCSAAFGVLMTACGDKTATSVSLPPDEIAVTAVGTTRGTAVQQMVSPAGGMVVSEDGRLTVDVPPGALASAQMLSIQAISSEAPGGVGTAYRLGPEGTTFSSPVKLTFSYDDSDLVGSEAAALKIAYQDSRGSWNAIKSVTRDESAQTISVVTLHFSDWSKLEGWQLRPGNAVLRPGERVELVVNNCSQRVDGEDDLSNLRNKCRPDPDFFTVQKWTVNGFTNGDSQVGTIEGATETSATFVAPATAPFANPVAVSASATDRSTGRKTVLTANIYIDATPPLVGTITSTQKEGDLVLTTTATVKFVYDLATDMYRPAAGSTLNANWDVHSGSCQTHGEVAMVIAKSDGMILVTELGHFASGHTVGTFVGSSTCNGLVESFSHSTDINWWPAPAASILPFRPDGSISGGYTNMVLASGKIISAQWNLTPAGN